MHPLCHAQKVVIATFAELFEQRIQDGKEDEIAAMVRGYNDNCSPRPAHSQRLSHFFFIWIGTLPARALAYIDVWRDCLRPSDKLTIYYDSHFLLFNHYAATLRRLSPQDAQASPRQRVAAQDRLYAQLQSLCAEGLCFDQALQTVSAQLLPGWAAYLAQQRQTAQSQLATLATRYTLVDIRSDTTVFIEPFYHQIYQMELMLRANAAAASDILRLLLLYRHGGIYLDVDTLPSLRPIFGPLAKGANVNVQNIVRSAYFLHQRRGGAAAEPSEAAALERYEQYLLQQDPAILQHIQACTASRQVPRLPPPEIRVHPQLISLCALESGNEYNNNLLAAAPQAKLLRILLRTLKQRYQFILRYQLQRHPSLPLPRDHYLARLVDYRYDAMSDAPNVTLFLSGPIFILEVLLGVAYALLPLQKSISPLALSHALGLGCSAIACREHTTYTPAHMQSSWR